MRADTREDLESLLAFARQRQRAHATCQACFWKKRWALKVKELEEKLDNKEG